MNLFTRPRRFGKTLSLSMLQTFFEAEMDENGKAVDNRRYFEGMKIGEAGKECFDHMGQYPVIRLSLKSAKQPDFEIAYKCLRDEIAWEFQRHRYLLKADGMEETDKGKYRTLRDGKGDYQQYATSLLFLTGYLKAVSQRFDRNRIYLTMRIPNEEIRYIYDNTIREWFAVKLKAVDFTSFYRTIMEGDSTAFEMAVKGQLRESISFYDRKEGFYHGFLLGLLGALQYYEVVSNRESGDGRPDIMLKPYDELEPAVIMEIKCVEKFTLMEAACDKALEQIEKMDYEAGLLEEGYRKIWKYGICFCKKSCMVKLAGDGSR